MDDSYILKGDPIIQAAASGDFERIKQLIAGGADLNARGGHQETALHWAALKGRADIADLLVHHGIDINATDMTGKSAVTIAEEYGYSTLAAELWSASRHGASASHVATEDSKRSGTRPRSLG